MTSLYEKLIINRREKRCRSPTRKQKTQVPSRSLSPKYNMKTSNEISFFKSASLSLLLRESEGQGGELHHVMNPNHSSSESNPLFFEKSHLVLNISAFLLLSLQQLLFILPLLSHVQYLSVAFQRAVERQSIHSRYLYFIVY